MAVPQNKQQPLIPDLPRDPRAIDAQGMMTAQWSLFFEQLIQSLQNVISPEGMSMPSQTTDNIGQLTQERSVTDIVYDTTVNAFKGNMLNSFIPDDLQQYTWVPFAMITSNAGNPNGAVAGLQYWLCWNTSGNQMYVCTTSGNATTAEWTLV